MAYSPLHAAIDEVVKARLTSAMNKANHKLNRMAKQVRALRLAVAAFSKGGGAGAGGAGQGSGWRVGKRASAPAVDPAAIRAFREQLALSRSQFARIVGVHLGSIYGWEMGTAQPVGKSAEKFLAIQKIGVEGVRKRLVAGWTAPKKMGRPAGKKVSRAAKAAMVANAAKARAAKAAKAAEAARKSPEKRVVVAQVSPAARRAKTTKTTTNTV